MEQGLIQIYTGPGKGKTTAATGLVVRALGHGLRVLLVRLLKPAEPRSGEIRFLSGAPGLELLEAGIGVFGDPPSPTALAASVAATFDAAVARLAAGDIDLAVFDEINGALHRGLLPLAEVLALCDGRPAGTELVFTGRNAPRALLERADLVTVMENLRHPFAAGSAARRGIEY